MCKDRMVLITYPCRMFPKVTSFILYRIWMAQLTEESNFFEDILPLLVALLPHVGHFLNSHNFLSESMASVVDSAEASMANLTEIFKNAVRIVMIK